MLNDSHGFIDLTPIAYNDKVVRRIFSFLDAKTLSASAKLISKEKFMLAEDLEEPTSLLEYIQQTNIHSINLPINNYNNNPHIDDLQALLPNAAPLAIASFLNSLSAIRLALRQGAKINHSDKNGWTALFYAVYYGNIEATECLLDNNADINHQDVDANTVLHILALTDNPSFKLFKLLLARDKSCLIPNIVRINNRGEDPTMIFDENKDRNKNTTTCWQIANRLDIPFTEYSYQYDALEKEMPAAFKKFKQTILENNGSNRNKDPGERTSNIEQLQSLHYNYGNMPSFFAKKNTIKSLFPYAIKAGSHEVVKFLLKDDSFGTDISDQHGNLPLHLAVAKKDCKLIELLLKSDALDNLDKPNNHQQTPLQLASSLLERAQTRKDKKPLRKIVNYLKVAELIKSDKLNQPDSLGNYPLHQAVNDRNFPLLKLLINTGANTEVYNTHQQTPLILVNEQIALLEREHPEDIKYINLLNKTTNAINYLKKMQSFIEDCNKGKLNNHAQIEKAQQRSLLLSRVGYFKTQPNKNQSIESDNTLSDQSVFLQPE
ncbi:MAG: uncharacterized protein K0S11_1191 [Gammaproteobacteria bacterium]|nr:uncharacterized protein [Gammaproteobacteria bacterium]